MCDENIQCKKSKKANDGNRGAVVMSGGSNVISPPRIFKLNVDCFMEVFDWLSLKQLLVIRRTCKRMKQVADYYIKLNYRYLSNIGCNENRLEELRHFGGNFINEIVLERVDIQHILNRIESLTLDASEINGELFVTFLQFCTNLKYLCIKTSTPEWIIGTGNEWLLRSYPTLEHFNLDVNVVAPANCKELRTFFELNPNIRTFSTSSGFIFACYCSMIGSNIRFNRLVVRVDGELDFICDALYELYEQGFYNKLDICCHAYPDVIQYVPTLRALEKLYLWTSSMSVDLPIMPNIRELTMDLVEYVPKQVLEMMPSKFINLRRVYISCGVLGDIWPFIRHSVSVEEIIINQLYQDDEDWNVDVSDISALNNEREQLFQARKITLYINEEIYIRLKWKMKTSFSLIELRRSESCEERNGFDWRPKESRYEHWLDDLV